MNRTYSIVWSTVRNMYVVASELARSNSKVKIQAHLNPSIGTSESGLAINAKHNALALAIVAALGFASPLAIADNQVSYTDGATHDLSADSTISYSGTGQGAALYLEGHATPQGSWQPTKGTGTGVVIEADGGGDPLQEGGYAVASAVSLANGATLDLTDVQITTEGTYTAGINLQMQSSMTLNGGTIKVGGEYGILVLSDESYATLIGTTVTATENTSDIVSQKGSTLIIKDGSEITLTDGQVRVVGETTYNSFLDVIDSTVSSSGTDSTVSAGDKGVLNITNSTVTHTNTEGAAIEATNASTVTISGDKNTTTINSSGIGIKSSASILNIDGATINANKDGIIITSKGKTGFYDDLSALTTNDTDVTSKTIALNIDSGTTINDPIKLTNSTFTAPTAIKLGSKVNIQADNTTLVGNIIQTDMSSSSLSLNQGSALTGSVDAMFTTLSLDETSQWNMTGSSTLKSLTNYGTINIGNDEASAQPLQITNALTLESDSQLNITLSAADSPIITTGSATLDGSLTLNIDSTAAFGNPASDQQFKSIILIDSGTEISTNFASLTTNIDNSSQPDYLTFGVGVDTDDNTNFVLEQELSWNAGATSISKAHGNFTLDDDETFEVTSKLSKVSAVTGGWDGETLTKEGNGALILSNTANDYGDTHINGGTLAAKDAASLGSGDVTIAESARLSLDKGTLDNDVNGEGEIVKSGSEELIVTGDNNYSGGTTITGGKLTADNADSLGTG
ncbi:autotransporter-associated beta strand repeat-containing protein, partial [Salmonella enterica subsp. enterica serovar Enteritidis]|nr:fibronectin-binding autotransporter adhesin ShdA [Salmonella enterica subsp. enterica serovar Eboko]EGS4978147.1 fibronectin-binding autotransporter adhesin ShdA [Salmonella enterica subsp. enterica serovar Eboko]EIL1353554.1 autotransporter-associated beta strand repeat-containing protein [Salmonella enterica subsp. enterica serovar Enteritidis]EIO9994189.1 autotransporter-associated beta strand repeat-containing protein [Salmonella enterica subsp. enterica serovar Enteritidis]